MQISTIWVHQSKADIQHKMREPTLMTTHLKCRLNRNETKPKCTAK